MLPALYRLEVDSRLLPTPGGWGGGGGAPQEQTMPKRDGLEGAAC